MKNGSEYLTKAAKLTAGYNVISFELDASAAEEYLAGME